jgi:hypothetical protein
VSECAKDVSIGVSVFTLTALSAERYYAIVNPMRRHVSGRLSTKPVTQITTLGVWVLAVLLAVPAAIFSYVPEILLEANKTIKVNPSPRGILLPQQTATVPLCNFELCVTLLRTIHATRDVFVLTQIVFDSRKKYWCVYSYF